MDSSAHDGSPVSSVMIVVMIERQELALAAEFALATEASSAASFDASRVFLNASSHSRGEIVEVGGMVIARFSSSRSSCVCMVR